MRVKKLKRKAARDRSEEFFMIRLAKMTFQAEQKPVWNCGWRHWRRRWNAWRIPYLGRHLVSQFVVASLCRRSGFQHRWRNFFCKRSGKGPTGKASGLTWTRGMLLVCAQRPATGTFLGSTGRMASSFFFLIKKKPFVLDKDSGV